MQLLKRLTHEVPPTRACYLKRKGGMRVLTLFVRSVLLFIAAVIAMRVMGKRQVGQLQPFELVVVIMIAELAASPMGDVGVPLLNGVIPVLALVACHGIIAWLCMVSEKFRVWMCGQPTILMRNGVICEKQMRKMAFTLNDLMEAMRQQGIADPSQAETVVLETGGRITVFPKPQARPVTPEDLGLDVGREGLPLPLIVDGHMQADNLRRGGMTEAWLTEKLREAGHAPEQVLLACLNQKGMLFLQGKGRTDVQMIRLMSENETGW